MTTYSQRQRRKKAATIGCCIVVVLVIIVGGLIGGAAYKGSERSETAKVNSKERVCKSGNSDCAYLVFTDKDTFQVTDSLINGRFNSSDVYGQIQQGQTYNFRVQGWRVPIASWYPPIPFPSATPPRALMGKGSESAPFPAGRSRCS